ncbi:hypothetical protein [Bordetella genomosp. 9]|uniref:hypothetical protein n=1 Tax=Bordetella genomosp. 9 TaxID=1416803 RepID=UPI0012FB9DD0|nr:hypothetical protein [Bordetella genomosp. 9]
MNRTIHLKGPSLNSYFAEQMVKEYGPAEALTKTSGPMREAVKAVIQALEDAAKPEGGKA